MQLKAPIDNFYAYRGAVGTRPLTIKESCLLVCSERSYTQTAKVPMMSGEKIEHFAAPEKLHKNSTTEFVKNLVAN